MFSDDAYTWHAKELGAWYWDDPEQLRKQSASSFVKAMSTGDPAHIKAFLKFAKSNPVLLDGLRTKNYEKIAEGHNGADWRKVNPEYATNLEKFAKDYK